jgi:uncharacterized protein (DUF58 family)
MTISADFLHQLDKFSLIINKRITSNYTGARLSTAHGRGFVLKDYRIYAPGDDFRAIDWKVYARTDKLHIKKYEEERSMKVHVLLDCSASMHFGSKHTKYEYGSMMGVGFAYIAMKQNEKFQYCTFGEGLQVFRPARGMHQIVGMIDHLNKVKPAGASKFYEALTQYKKFLKEKAFIVIISDFLVDAAEVKQALAKLGDHDIQVIQVLDAKEVSVDLKGELTLHDVETKGAIRTFISNRARSSYQQKLKQHVLDIESHCESLGIKFKLVSTDKPVFDSFWEMLK